MYVRQIETILVDTSKTCGMRFYRNLFVYSGFYTCTTVTSKYCTSSQSTGIGWGMIIVSSIMSIYYNVIIAWILYFLGMSMRDDAPWAGCGHEWNTDNCIMAINTTRNSSTYNATNINPKGMSAAEEFWT